MSVLKGDSKINNLPFDNLYQRIVVPFEDRTVQSYHDKPKDYQEAQRHWQRQTDTFPEIRKVGEIFSKDYDPVLAQHWKDYDLLRTAYGLAVMDMELGESYDVRVASIYAKALGSGMVDVRGLYIAQVVGKGMVEREHQVVGIQPPASVIDKLPSTRIVDLGQTISSYSDTRLGIEYFIQAELYYLSERH